MGTGHTERDSPRAGGGGGGGGAVPRLKLSKLLDERERVLSGRAPPSPRVVTQIMTARIESCVVTLALALALALALTLTLTLTLTLSPAPTLTLTLTLALTLTLTRWARCPRRGGSVRI